MVNDITNEVFGWILIFSPMVSIRVGNGLKKRRRKIQIQRQNLYSTYKCRRWKKNKLNKNSVRWHSFTRVRVRTASPAIAIRMAISFGINVRFVDLVCRLRETFQLPFDVSSQRQSKCANAMCACHMYD